MRAAAIAAWSRLWLRHSSILNGPCRRQFWGILHRPYALVPKLNRVSRREQSTNAAPNPQESSEKALPPENGIVTILTNQPESTVGSLVGLASVDAKILTRAMSETRRYPGQPRSNTRVHRASMATSFCFFVNTHFFKMACGRRDLPPTSTFSSIRGK